MAPRPLTVGTAGHVDHGKTTLVRALTGRETDRLAEERRRGMSIELGFAPLDVGGRRLSLVDVPGHERFLRTMVAGASGIDMFVLVVAADDGPMPQTREHLTVLRAFGVRRGVVALTKVDLVDAGTVRSRLAESAMLVPGAPLVEVSAPRGKGMEELRAAMAAVAAEVDAERDAEMAGTGPPTGAAGAKTGDAPVLHIDRVFTLAGHGTIVTGTLWSGRLERGRRVLLLPGGREARIRSLEVHDEPVESAGARQRVAVNLAGVGRDEVARGDLLTTAGAEVETTYRIDAELTEGAAEIVRERRVQMHLGTREGPARIVDLGGGTVQLRLEQPLLARCGDRFVVRRIAPPDTLGGGLVRHPSPPRHGRDWAPESAGDVASPESGRRRRAMADIGRSTGSPPKPGALARRLMAELEAGAGRPPGLGALAERLEAERREVERALGELEAAGMAVRLKADLFYPARVYADLRGRITSLARERGSTSIGEVRDELGLSRRYAQALLEALDAERLLRRDGDRHVPRGRL